MSAEDCNMILGAATVCERLRAKLTKYSQPNGLVQVRPTLPGALAMAVIEAGARAGCGLPLRGA